ncbi:MAG: MBL fold metallo-hydrolase [Micrococcales bacterium]|nr:MBL fold metallo-hydrolase [Micrococcales bacterium]
MQIDVISTEELGDRSYVVTDGSTAVVIDPQRDLDRVEEVLAVRGVHCGLVLETHIHNDYVTGGHELARRHGCPYVVSADDEVAFERHAVKDGDTLSTGSLTVRAVATPGHTDTHMAYVIVDSTEPDAAPAVFTGGSLLYGSVGRTDLVDTTRTDELTRAQFHSARRLASELPDETGVYPTHGFGSFCSSGSAAGGDGGTIGGEKERNDALTTDDEDAFVETLIANLTAYPAYYAHMGSLNRQGPGPADLTAPAPVTPEQLRASMAAGDWVVDLRDRTAYAAEHLVGSIGIPGGAQFSTYLGWLIPWGTPLTLIGETEEEVAKAQRDLTRIGIDQLAGRAVADIEALADQGAADVGSYPRATFGDLPAELLENARTAASATETEPARVVLDVRRDDERAGGAVRGSVHVPLHSLLQRMDEVPDAQLWVHCASGLRSAIAASLLARAGKDVVYIDDSYDNAVSSGLTSDGA